MYLVFRYVAADEVSPWAIGGLGLTLIWTVIGNRVWASRPIDWSAAAVSLLLCGYIAVRYEPLTYEIALLPREGIIGSAVLTILVLEGSRRISGWGFVGIILAMAICPATSRPVT